MRSFSQLVARCRAPFAQTKRAEIIQAITDKLTGNAAIITTKQSGTSTEATTSHPESLTNASPQCAGNKLTPAKKQKMRKKVIWADESSRIDGASKELARVMPIYEHGDDYHYNAMEREKEYDENRRIGNMEPPCNY